MTILHFKISTVQFIRYRQYLFIVGHAFFNPIPSTFIAEFHTTYCVFKFIGYTSIINPHHSIPESQLVSSNTWLNGWFGISFQDELHINHIQAPEPSEILTLYNLHNHIPFYPFILSESIIRQLVVHILPSCLAQELAIILSLPNLVQFVTSSHHKCIIHCIHLQPMSISSTWKDVYTADKDTAIFM